MGQRRQQQKGGPQQKGGSQQKDQNYAERNEFDERIIDITRVAKVIKGGRRFAFRVSVVVGDNKGNVGFGMGKSRTVPEAIRKALDGARKSMAPVSMVGSTIPHEIIGEHGAAKVLLKPASPGTGVIAGGGVRAVVEAAGYKDILTKSLGSANVLNVIQATMDGLRHLKYVRQEADDRGKEIIEVTPFWSRK
jgi:small subunit ribosomal protein S5